MYCVSHTLYSNFGTSTKWAKSAKYQQQHTVKILTVKITTTFIDIIWELPYHICHCTKQDRAARKTEYTSIKFKASNIKTTTTATKFQPSFSARLLLKTIGYKKTLCRAMFPLSMFATRTSNNAFKKSTQIIASIASQNNRRFISTSKMVQIQVSFSIVLLYSFDWREFASKRVWENYLNEGM